MVRCSKTSLLFSNSGRLNTLCTFIQEYQKVCQFFIDLIWDMEKVPSLLPKEITQQVSTWLSKRAVQCAGKQASGIVRGTQQKQKQRLYKYNQFLKEGMFKKARKLKAVIDKVKMSKPLIHSIQPELDSRFVKVNWDTHTKFDGWITISSIGGKLKITLPFKKTKHFNWMMSRGVLKQGVRISPKDVTFNFEIQDTPLKDSGKTIGIDIGMKTVVSCSNGHVSQGDQHGWTLDSIQEKMSRRKKGSKGFRRAQTHRKNHIHWTINQLNLHDIKKVKLENIKHLRKGSKSSRKLSHWTYAMIFDKLNSLCSQSGVQIERVNSTYTSQRCSQCGWTRKNNRKGKQFKCGKCDFTIDADLNASSNIVLDLSPIGKKERLKHPNRTGFYWNVKDQEPIVPGVQKTVEIA